MNRVYLVYEHTPCDRPDETVLIEIFGKKEDAIAYIDKEYPDDKYEKISDDLRKKFYYLNGIKFDVVTEIYIEEREVK